MSSTGQIKIIFTRPKSVRLPIIAWIIMFVEGTKFSHCCIQWHSNYIGEDITYEAVGSGVNFLGSHQFHKKHRVVQEFTLSTPEEREARRQLVRWCVQNSGKPYGFKALAGLGLVRLAKLFGKRIKNPFPDGDASQICVEACILALEAVGIIESRPKDFESMGLVEIEDYIRHLKRERQGNAITTG